MIARIPLVLEPQPEGGYTVTSPLLPELITEGETISECLVNAEDAFAVVLEIYEDEGASVAHGDRCGRRQGSGLRLERSYGYRSEILSSCARYAGYLGRLL